MYHTTPRDEEDPTLQILPCTPRPPTGPIFLPIFVYISASSVTRAFVVRVDDARPTRIACYGM